MDRGKRILRIGISIIGYMLILLYAIGFEIKSLFDFKSMLMVIIGTILLTVGSYKKGMNMGILCDSIKTNALLVGYLTAFLLIYGAMLQGADSVPVIMKEVALCCRPIFYGLFIHILFAGWEETYDIKAENKKQEDTQKELGLNEKQKRLSEFFKEKKLTEREIEIVACICEGMSNRDIGEKLYISEATVKKHTNNLYRKLQIGNREELKSYCKDRYLN